MAEHLTLDQLQLWMAELGIQKVMPTVRPQLPAEVAANMRAKGLDPDTTTYVIKGPEEAPFFHLTEFSGDDTGGQPCQQLTVYPFRGEVPCAPDYDFGDGCVVFHATSAGEVESIGFFETFSGFRLWDSEKDTRGTWALIPGSVKELEEVLQGFRIAFGRFCLELLLDDEEQEGRAGEVHRGSPR